MNLRSEIVHHTCRTSLTGPSAPFPTIAGDLAVFWAIDGGVEMIKLFVDYGADLDAVTPKGWSPLSYSKAKGKYGATEEHGIYPEVRSAALQVHGIVPL